jgi:hypothetical protein
MASDVEITRLALSHIADAARVNSIEPPDSTIQAQHAATFYPIARDFLLEKHDWSFALKRTELALSLVEFEDGEWAYSYSLPSDYIRAIRVCPPGVSKDFPGEEFKIVTDESELDTLILTNVEEAVLHYVFRETATGRYSPTFVVALSLVLGAFLAGPILKGKLGAILRESLMEQGLAMAKQAAALNANANKDRTQYGGYTPKWISDR